MLTGAERAIGLGWESIARRWLGDLDGSAAAAEKARSAAAAAGLGWHLPSYQMVRAAERFAAGEWDDAIAEVEASVELAGETGQAFGLILGRSVLAMINLHRNELGRAQQAVSAAIGQLVTTGARYRTQWAIWAEALLLEARGEIVEAFSAMAGCWDQCAELGLTLEYRMLGADLVRLAVARGDGGRARDVAAAVAEIAAENQRVPSLAGAALRCRGLAENDAEILQAAVAAYAPGSRPLELALASEEAGTAFLQRGMADQARPLLENAVEIYERLGAARDLARAEAVLRNAGIRRGRRGTRSRPQAGWHSLTPTERTIAGLVAEGLSNPQIGDRLYISRRTVQTHLAHVFAELDLTSRAYLAAEVTRRENAAAGDPAVNAPP